MLPHLEQLLYAHGIRKKDHYQPSQGTCRATELCFYQVGFLSLSTDRSPQQGGLSSSTHTCWISAWIIRTWDLSTDYSQCPQQLSKCSLSSWMNKEGISSRCCSFAGALTRGKDALHKQTPLHTTAALEHLECTSGSISSPLLIAREGVSNQKQQLYQDRVKPRVVRTDCKHCPALRSPFLN